MLSVPFADIASKIVATIAIKIDFTKNNCVLEYAKTANAITKDITNITAEPATDFVAPNILNFLLSIPFPASAAKPSPYAIMKNPTKPISGLFVKSYYNITNGISEAA